MEESVNRGVALQPEIATDAGITRDVQTGNRGVSGQDVGNVSIDFVNGFLGQVISKIAITLIRAPVSTVGGKRPVDHVGEPGVG